MGSPTLPPSRFGAGYSVGAPPSAPVAASPSASPAGPSVRVNPLAAAAFGAVLLLGPLVIWLTVPMALVARSQITTSGEAGSGLATAALALSSIYLALAMVVGLLLLGAP